jgi:ketosteroid isomerase-like protein
MFHPRIALPIFLAALPIVTALVVPPASARVTAAATADPMSTPAGAVAAFVAAVNALDQQRYAATLADNVSVFFPGPPFPPRLVQGKAEVMGDVGRLFDALHAQGVRANNVAPAHLAFQTFRDLSIATFDIPGRQDVSRRTIVLQRIAGRWLIIHLHASSARDPAAEAPPQPGAAPGH